MSKAESKTKTPKDPSQRGRRKYFSDYPFQDIPKKNGKGTKARRVYSGNYYSYVIPDDYKDSPQTFISRIKGFYIAISLLALVLWVAGSLVGAASQTESAFYVVGPYIIMVFPIVLTIFTTVEFLLTKNTRYERVFADALSTKLRNKTLFVMIGSGFCAVTDIAYLIIKAAQGMMTDGVVMLTSGFKAFSQGAQLIADAAQSNLPEEVINYVHVTTITIPFWYDVIYIALFIALGFLAFFFLKLQDSLKIEPV